jgi:hypothetical protein
VSTQPTTQPKTETIKAICRRCKKESEFPLPETKDASELNFSELVFTRRELDIQGAELLYRTTPRVVIAEMFACSCGGPYQVINERTAGLTSVAKDV